MSEDLVGGEVIHGHDLDFGVTLGALCFHCAEEVAANAAEAVDAYSHRHNKLLK